MNRVFDTLVFEVVRNFGSKKVCTKLIQRILVMRPPWFVQIIVAFVFEKSEQPLMFKPERPHKITARPVADVARPGAVNANGST